MKKHPLQAFLAIILWLSYTVSWSVEISDVPIEESIRIKPNLIFAMDDSGSMGFEVLLPTSDGALWWDVNSQTAFENDGSLYFNQSGKDGNQNGHNWKKYTYVFPRAISDDPRKPTNDNYNHHYIPHIDMFAFVRSPDYNALYYNTHTTYKPWEAAYDSGGNNKLITFPDANPEAARTHPIYPTSGNPVTLDLTQSQYQLQNNRASRVYAGMPLPANSNSQRVAKKFNGANSWSTVANAGLVSNNDSGFLATEFYPATFYLKDSTCPAAPSTACVSAPDGSLLRKYEIKPGNTFPSGRSYQDEMQNFANWFTYYRNRKLMLSAAMGQVLTEIRNIRGGIIGFNDRNTVTMYDFNDQDNAKNFRKLLRYIYDNPASGGTPIRKALGYIGEQYRNNNNIVTDACQMNVGMIMTDGFASSSAPSYPSYNQSTFGSGTPYSPTYSNSIADIALSYYTINVRPDLATGLVNLSTSTSIANSVNPDNNDNLHMNTYAMTLGALGHIYGKNSSQTENPFTYFPSWPIPDFSRSPSSIDDLWHATINGRGLMLDASNATDAVTALKQVLRDVIARAGSSSAVGIANTNVSKNENIAYIATYNNNQGDLKAVKINTATGAIEGNNIVWSAASQLNQKTAASRLIATYDDGVAIPFQWNALPQSMKDQLTDSTVLDWIRGDKSQEGSLFRKRSSLLGDIGYAESVLVAGALANYQTDNYPAFKNTVASRQKMIYQAANDGMLHAFDASTGEEKWAYIPSHIFAKLADLSLPDYAHKFYVDGTPVRGDVLIDNSWKTMLVGGMRAGGKGYYALDITDPASIQSESHLAAKVMWEFPNNNTASTVVDNLGLSFGKPIIVNTKAAGWVVLVTSGYNNDQGDGKGHLFVLNPKTGAVIRDIVTTAGNSISPSGLASIAAYADNPSVSAMADFVYGGDLLGNVWRFDLSGDSIDQWNVKLLATLTDSTGTAQPITTEPELTEYDGKRLVYVGTGKLLSSTDISDTQTQTMYVLVDDMSSNPTISPLHTNLVQRVINGNLVEGDPIDFTTHRGWYLDLPNTGERISTNPVLVFNSLIFNTNAPSNSGCFSRSYQYVLSFNTGVVLDASYFEDQTPWAVRDLGNTLVSRPSIMLINNGSAYAINQHSDSTISSNVIPSQYTGEARKIAWKEILRE